MRLYVVTYVHPDEHRWLEHLAAHLQWIERRLARAHSWPPDRSGTCPRSPPSCCSTLVTGTTSTS
jgi:hypothetical protein